MMIRINYLCVMVLMSSLSMAGMAQEAAAPVDAGGAPEIFCPEKVFDWGSIDNIHPVEHNFTIQNKGTAPLTITEVKTSCGCTAARPEKNELAPGEETVVEVALSLKGRVGTQKKTVTLISNDPKTPKYVLTLQGKALAVIKVEPNRVDFGVIADDEPRSKTIRVSTDRPDVVFHITKVQTPKQMTITSETKTVEEGKSYDITLNLAGELKPVFYSGQLVFSTDLKSMPKVTAVVSAKVVGPYQVRPTQISARPGGGAQSVRVEPGRVQSFEIVEAIAPMEGVKLQYEAMKDMPGFRLIVSGIPSDANVDGKEIVLRTNVEAHPEIRIPIRYYPNKGNKGNPGARRRQVPGTQRGRKAPLGRPAAGVRRAPAPKPPVK
jgi:hypothetical protein